MTAPRRNRRRTAPANSAVAYIRVSTDEQAQSGLGLDAQRATIAAEAERRGLTIVEWFSDEGISGNKTTERRPGLLAALHAVNTGAAETMIVAKLDRLSRNFRHAVNLIEAAEEQAWSLFSCDGTVDMTTPTGKFQTRLWLGIAALERDTISQRTKAALAAKKARGERLGRPQALPDDVVRRVMDERAGGRTLQAIADGLKADGIPTSQGGTWSPSNVRAVLKSQRADALRARDMHDQGMNVDEISEALDCNVKTVHRYLAADEGVDAVK